MDGNAMRENVCVWVNSLIVDRSVRRSTRLGTAIRTVERRRARETRTRRRARAMALGLACSVRFRNCGVRVRVRARDGTRERRATTTTRAVSAATTREEEVRAPVRAVEGVERDVDEREDDDADDAVERIELAYEIVVPSYEGGAREAWSRVSPLLAPRNESECRACERAMTDILRCDVVHEEEDDENDRVVVVRQTSKWRHNALIGGKSVTKTRCTSDDDEMSMTFEVDANRDAASLREYVGSTEIVRPVDATSKDLIVRMRGEAKIDRPTSFASRLIRDVTVNAMRSQMRSSLADIRAFLSPSSS